MTGARSSETFGDLPRRLPLFPLAGALLLPGGRLPLNVFEPRYLAMVGDALAGPGVIGMIQPTDPDSDEAEPAIYRTGCAGRIVAHSETEDGHRLITLAGLCRFDVIEELTVATPYRQAFVSFARYRRDLEGEEVAGADGGRLMAGLRAFLDTVDVRVDWEAVDRRPDRRVIHALAMACPFAPSEKQALLEAPSFDERCRVLTALAERVRRPAIRHG